MNEESSELLSSYPLSVDGKLQLRRIRKSSLGNTRGREICSTSQLCSPFARHPRFNGHYYFNDIMIIDLGKEIKQTGVRPVCLVGESDKDHEVEGQMAAVFGLGKISKSPKSSDFSDLNTQF